MPREQQIAKSRIPAPPKRPAAEDAYAAARNSFLKGKKLDMVALAARLGVGRATLYRWTGPRERLINTVLAGFMQDAFVRIERRLDKAGVAGAERVARSIEEMIRILATSRPVHALLRNEPDVALRILTGGGAGSLQAASIVHLEGIIARERADGNYRPRLEAPLLAYTAVRLVYSFVYGDIIARIPVHLADASKVIRSLL